MSSEKATARVLIVDDDPATLRVVGRFLRERGYEPVTTRSGPEALEVIASERVDAVLLDMNMPGMNGFAVLSRLRRLHPSIPTIIVSGVIDASLAQQSFRDGAFDYLVKPFHLENLVQTLEQALQSAAPLTS